MAEYYIGEIRVFSGSYVPQGWVMCNGSLLNVAEYQALYALLGNLYGGTANQTFGVPNLNGTVPVGKGQLTGGSNYVLAQGGGVTDVTLTVAQGPAHSHPFNVNPAPATTGTPTNSFLAQTNGDGSTLQPPYPDVKLYITPPAPGANATLAPTTISTTQGGASHTNLMPFMVLNYIIATNGLFPQQS